MSDCPSYQSMCSLRVTTLSPLSAEIGITSRSGIDSFVANELNSSWIRSNVARS